MFNQLNFGQLDFKYIFPDSKTIQYCCSCIINRTIKKHLERKKLKIINKIVHIFLEDSINEAKKNYILNVEYKTNILCKGDVVTTMYGKGVIKDIISDDIIIIALDENINNEIYTYLKRKYVALLYSNNDISEDIINNSQDSQESQTEDYSDDFETEDELDHSVNNDTITISYIGILYNFIKKQIFG